MFLQTQGHTEQSSEVKWGRKQQNKTKTMTVEEKGWGRLREHGIAIIRMYLINGYCQRLNSIHLIFKNLGMVLHVYDPSYSRHWSGRILSWGQPELHRNTPSLKKEGDKRKIHWDYLRMNILYLTRLWACPSNSWNIVGFHLHISIKFYSLIIGNSPMFPQNRYDCHKGDLCSLQDPKWKFKTVNFSCEPLFHLKISKSTM